MRAAAIFMLASLAGCSGPKATQVVLGLVTDLIAPDELDHVELIASRDATRVAKADWDFQGIPSDAYELPGTFSLYTDDDSEPRLTVEVRALRADKPQATRTAVFNLVKGRTSFLRLGLSRKCVGITCGSGKTCVEGACQSSFVESATLPVYMAGMEKSLQCNSGSRFVRTSTQQLMPVTGNCAGNEVCLEGSCRMMDPSRELPDMGMSSRDGL